jgi:hypothetical protein
MDDNLLAAAIDLLEARANQMVTETEWEALAQAVKEETGQYVEWRTGMNSSLSDTMPCGDCGRGEKATCKFS